MTSDDSILSRAATIMKDYGQTHIAIALLEAIGHTEERRADTGLTAAQVWYATQVYPETVTDAEARETYDREVANEADRSYWDAAANALNRMRSI